VLAAARGCADDRREVVGEGRRQGPYDVQRLLSHPGRASRESQQELDRWLEGLGDEPCTRPATQSRSRHAGGPLHIRLCNGAPEEECLSPRGLAANRAHDHVPAIEPFAARIGLQRHPEDALASQRVDASADGATVWARVPLVGEPAKLGK
jgi:hypothetical protein